MFAPRANESTGSSYEKVERRHDINSLCGPGDPLPDDLISYDLWCNTLLYRSGVKNRVPIGATA